MGSPTFAELEAAPPPQHQGVQVLHGKYGPQERHRDLPKGHRNFQSIQSAHGCSAFRNPEVNPWPCHVLAKGPQAGYFNL